ncbi:hypothetical protein [Maritalea mediterranea]|uniref:Uncharacterized protein n=1 Tax=Maritalea mediterranea TaxID=2909667 RepID=A0ABS9E8R4_9HYPH|nr:hypothetical protein [Maritalea mediterranea]MCF4099242.1 hypothetical protein [Maritalea mediterranea]
MLKSLLHGSTKSFEKQYGYDAGYMHQIIDVSSTAGLRLGLLPMLSQYRGPKAAKAIWAGAALAFMLDADCGSCAQLIVDQSIELGVDPKQLEICAKGEADPSHDCRLGFLFAQAAISGAMDVGELRAEIVRRYGEEAAVAAGFAAACGRVYPVLKRAMGNVDACALLRFEPAVQNAPA